MPTSILAQVFVFVLHYYILNHLPEESCGASLEEVATATCPVRRSRLKYLLTTTNILSRGLGRVCVCVVHYHPAFSPEASCPPREVFPRTAQLYLYFPFPFSAFAVCVEHTFRVSSTNHHCRRHRHRFRCSSSSPRPQHCDRQCISVVYS